MTVEQLRTEWPTIRAEAQARWTKLSDADLDSVQADPNRLVDLIQRHYGYSRPIVIAEVDHFLQRIEVSMAAGSTT